MPVYEEKVKDKITGKMVVKKVGKDKQKQYYIRTYITDENGNKKQVTKHNKEWIGKDGYWNAYNEELLLKNKKISNKKIKFNILINEYLEEIEKTCKESTYVTYESAINSQIKPFFQKYYCNNLNANIFIKWHEYLNDKKLSIKYKNKCHTIMISILKKGITTGYISENYETNVGSFKNTREEKEKIIKDEEKIRYITYEQFKIFISKIESLLWYTFFNFLYFTGMRKGEVQALIWEDIDFENKKIRVIKTLTTKTKNKSPYKITSTKGIENRIIDMNEKLYIILKKYYEELSKNQKIKRTDFVFGINNPLAQTTIDNNLKKYLKKANLQRITPHEFRHSHVSLLISEYIKQGNTDTTKFFLIVGKRLGHTLEVMQKTYLHLFPSVQEEVVNLLDNLV